MRRTTIRAPKNAAVDYNIGRIELSLPLHNHYYCLQLTRYSVGVTPHLYHFFFGRYTFPLSLTKIWNKIAVAPPTKITTAAITCIERDPTTIYYVVAVLVNVLYCIVSVM